MGSLYQPYTTDWLRRALSISKMEGYPLRLADEVLFREKVFSPQPQNSRLLSDRTNYRLTAVFLLSQIDKPMLQSMLTHTLVSDAITQKVKLKPWAIIDTDKARQTVTAPGIYINYLADQHGQGLTIPQYEQYAKTMYAALRVKDLPGVPVVDLVEKAHEDLTGSSRSIMEEVRAKDQARMKDIAEDFWRKQRNIIESAKAEKATHISIPAEVGWAWNMNKRCKEHKNLVSSPLEFRLAQCVLRGLFYPTQEFRMYHFAVFRAFSWDHAEKGESIASQLFESYSTMGGWNRAQAGISINKSRKSNANEWLQAATNHPALLKFTHNRLLEQEAAYNERARNVKV